MLKVNVVKYRGDFAHVFRNTLNFGAYYLQYKGLFGAYLFCINPSFYENYAPNPFGLRKMCIKSPIYLMVLTFNRSRDFMHAKKNKTHWSFMHEK